MDLQGLRVLARGQSWSRNAQWMRDSQGPQEQWNHERRKSRLRWLVGRPDNEGLSHVICLANRILAGMMSSGVGKHLSGWVSPLLSLPPLGKGMPQLAHWFQVLEDAWNRAPPGELSLDHLSHRPDSEPRWGQQNYLMLLLRPTHKYDRINHYCSKSRTLEWFVAQHYYGNSWLMGVLLFGLVVFLIIPEW